MHSSFVVPTPPPIEQPSRGRKRRANARPLSVAAALVGLAMTHCSTQRSPGSNHDAGATSDVTTQDAAMCSVEQGLRLYDERIDPLFRQDRPSTCNQCHLSGISLKQYVQGSPCETYACLVQQRLVDERSPEDSKVLSWIKRAQPESELITQAVIDAEYDAFYEWLSFNARCDQCASVTCPLPSDAGTFCPDEAEDPHAKTDAGVVDPGGCDQEALETVFRTAVYAQRGRCSPCHFNVEESVKYEAPQWIEVAPDCETGSRVTLGNVIRNGYVNLDAPERSLLLLKPLAESHGGVAHGGGDKFDGLNDPGYQSFLYFLQRLATCENEPTD